MHEFDFDEIMRKRDNRLTELAEAFRKASGADGYEVTEQAEEDYVNDVDEYLTERLPILLEQGRVEDAWNTAFQAFTQVDEDDFDFFDTDELHDLSLLHLRKPALKVTAKEDRERFLDLLIALEAHDELPGCVRSSAAILAHDVFDEPELLEKIAAWYEEMYRLDPVETGAFWKGKLIDIAERLGNSEKWLAVCDRMDECDPLFVDMVYAEAIARRGDDRCVAVWDRVEKELDPESEEDESLLYSILWARYDWYSEHGSEEEAREAEDALNDFIGSIDEDGCCCGDDDCGCGHHHHDDEEEHECCCGHHHDHEEGHECRCGHHHDDEE